MKLGVLLADGHEVYRRGLAAAIEAHPSLELAGEAADGRAALEALLSAAPDLALLEVRMPGLDGLEVCRRVAGLDIALPTLLVLLTSEPNPALAAEADRIGAAAVLSKHDSRQEICRRLVELPAAAE